MFRLVKRWRIDGITLQNCSSSGGVQLGLLVAAIIISVACICLPVIAMMCVEEEDDDYDWGG